MSDPEPANIARLPEPNQKIRIIRGKIPRSHEKEHLERENYESDQAEAAAAKVAGSHKEPWLNVIDAYEPASMPGFDEVLKTPEIRQYIRGKVLDVGAGTCWLSAKLSRLKDVEVVYPLDLSENFMTNVGIRLLNHFEAQQEKVVFVASDFNEIPLESESLDCAFFFASLHHSLAPIKTLQEVGRCVKQGGAIIIFENPPSTISIRKNRKRAIAISEQVTEYTHTREEFEYIIDFSRIGSRSTIPFDILSRKGWRLTVRKAFRKLNIEHILLNPPSYVFLVTK